MESQKDMSDEITKPVDFDSFEDILQHLGKNVISSGNFIYVVKLLGALIRNLTKRDDVQEKYISEILSSSSPNKTDKP